MDVSKAAKVLALITSLGGSFLPNRLTYDYKSLMHAYRLLGEAEELLRTGKITFPRPEKEVQFLKTVRNGTCGDLDHWGILSNKIDYLRDEVEPNSHLPEEANHAAINKLCIEILSNSLEEK